jgi:hypothetical protein
MNPILIICIIFYIIGLLGAISYFIFSTQAVIPELKETLQTIFKGIPVLSLAFSAFLWLFYNNNYENRTKIFVVVALFVDCIADWILVFDHLFLYGVGVFLLGHIFFIVALWLPPTATDENVPIHLIRGIPVLLVTIPVFIHLIYKLIVASFHIAIIVAVLIYGAIEIVVLWRAVARITYNPSTFEENNTRQIITLFGFCLFVFSDILLAYDAFVLDIPNPARDYLVLVSYWVAQFIIQFTMMCGEKVVDTDPDNVYVRN